MEASDSANQTGDRLRLVLGIILPTLLVMLISIGSVYWFIIPTFKENFLQSKREMIRELVNVAWSIMAVYENQERSGLLSRDEAQRRAKEDLEQLRYGGEGQDYFWISDLHPRLVMHPYSKELIGTDLTQFEDAGGKRLFMEIKEVLSGADSGFIDYIWHRKYTEVLDVPKLSYVRKFEPWGWVVGTGVFLDDVERKTVELTRRLTRMIHAGVVLITLLLAVIALRSLVSERKRREAEEGLRRSQVKYKTLVETAVDPIMMVHNGTCLFANKGMEDLLGYHPAELETINLAAIAERSTAEQEKSYEIWENALHGYVVGGRHDLVLRRKDGRLVKASVTMSRKNLGSQKVVVLTARDVSAARMIEEELAERRDRFRLLAGRLQIGMFRTGVKSGFPFAEVCEVTRELLGVDDERRLLDTPLTAFLDNNDDARELTALLKEQGFVKERQVSLKQAGGRSLTVAISMVVITDDQGRPLYCDGLLEDVSRQRQSEEERERLIVDLQTSLMYLNQPVRNSLSGFVSCELHTPIRTAAKLMSEAGRSAILVASETGAMVGIVTDLVLRERVVGGAISADAPVFQVMSAPLIYIDDSALVFEAVLLLQERGIKHLVVRDGNGTVSSVISNEELLDMHRYSSSFILEQIRRASSVEAIGVSLQRLPRIIKALIDCGAHAENITRVITTISDTVLSRIIDLALAESGEPPVSFAFVSVGSEGRGEQTLLTDQDNAIIYTDVDEDREAAVHDYFLRLGTMVCTALDQVGYRFCKGKVMAMNPDWCRPLAVWKGYFSRWIGEAGPEELMEVSIFFDFRCLYGSRQLTEELRSHIGTKAMKQKPFFYQMAQNTLLFKVPIDFFGKIAVESGGEHPNTFNIKHAMAQVVGFARIYAIYHGLESTGTLPRLDQMLAKGELSKEVHAEIREAYNYLMQLRFRHQVRRVEDGLEPDNHVHIDELSPMEKDLLEKIFSQLNQLRKRLSQVGERDIFF